MLQIQVFVNGQMIEYIKVVNRGPVEGSPKDQEWRHYDWEHQGGRLSGRVQHDRKEGPLVLVEKVIKDFNARAYTRENYDVRAR